MTEYHNSTSLKEKMFGQRGKEARTWFQIFQPGYTMLVQVALLLSALTYACSAPRSKSLMKVQDILVKLFYFLHYFIPPRPPHPPYLEWTKVEISKLELLSWSRFIIFTVIKIFKLDKGVFFLMFIFETDCEWGRGREKEGDRLRSRLQAPSCRHRAQCGARTPELQDHDPSRSQMFNRLSHPGAPGHI